MLGDLHSDLARTAQQTGTKIPALCSAGGFSDSALRKWKSGVRPHPLRKAAMLLKAAQAAQPSVAPVLRAEVEGERLVVMREADLAALLATKDAPRKPTHKQLIARAQRTHGRN